MLVYLHAMKTVTNVMKMILVFYANQLELELLIAFVKMVIVQSLNLIVLNAKDIVLLAIIQLNVLHALIQVLIIEILIYHVLVYLIFMKFNMILNVKTVLIIVKIAH